MFVSGPKKIAPGHYEAAGCTTNRTAPIVDAVVMTFQGIRTLYALGQTDEAYRGMELSRDSDIAIGASMALVFAASTIYGFASTSTCRELGGGRASPYQRPEVKRTREARRSEEAAEEAAVQARVKAKAAEDAAKDEPIVAPTTP